MSRIFHVRLNLDAVSADLNTLVDDAERGEWLRGFMSGASGGVNRFVDTSPSCLGWYNGASARRHAEGFHEKQSAKGKLSAEARKSNREATTVQPNLNHGSTEPQPNLNLSNNPIIEEENKPIIEQSNKPVRETSLRFAPPTREAIAAYCEERCNRIDPDRFIDHYESVGWMIGNKKMKSWKAAIRTWEANDLKRNPPACTRTQAEIDASHAWIDSIDPALDHLRAKS